jgi:hypothetical protein
MRCADKSTVSRWNRAIEVMARCDIATEPNHLPLSTLSKSPASPIRAAPQR